MADPAISVVIPLYNRAWCIADCIASAALKGLPAEMIIVDDGSSDDSLRVAQQAVVDLGLQDQVRIIEQTNAGPSMARNRAAAMARGDWLVFLDSDDLWFPWTAAVMIEALSGLPAAVDLVFEAGRNFADMSETGGYRRRACAERNPFQLCAGRPSAARKALWGLQCRDPAQRFHEAWWFCASVALRRGQRSVPADAGQCRSHPCAHAGSIASQRA